jgi:PAS domain S-box-containing protein
MDTLKTPCTYNDPDAIQVLDAIADAVFVIDCSFDVRLVNKAFSHLSGIQGHQAIGKKCYDIFPGTRCHTDNCPMTILLRDTDQEQIRYETDKIYNDRKSSPGIITASAYRDSEGTLNGIIEIISDMTPLYNSREKYRRAMGGVIQAMSLTIEKRDSYTACHQRRVTKMCRAIAHELDFSWERVQGLRMAAAIHDLGKILVPAAILNKSGDMTEHEMAIIRAHPQTAYDILKDIDFPWPIAETIYQHHERMDGSGYPRGLKGDEILLEARILAVADVFDAITRFRSYRPAIGQGSAMEELKSNAGTLYDTSVVDACEQVILKGKVNLDSSATK